MDERGNELNDELPEGRAELLQMLKVRGLDDPAFKNAARAWLDQISETEEEGRDLGVSRQLASIDLLEEAGYLEEALEAMNELLYQLWRAVDSFPQLYEKYYNPLYDRGEVLHGRLEGSSKA